MKQTLLLALFLVSAIAYCSISKEQLPQKTQDLNHGKITTIFYNAHNLFDATHDEGKDDWSYLPSDFPGKREYCHSLTNDYYKDVCLNSDWSDKKLALKINQIKKALEIVSPELPDLLGLCEVENENVVELLAKSLGYSRWIVTKGLDKRGIDNALLVKESSFLKVVNFNESIEINSPDLKRPTRNILRVELMVGGKHPLDVFVNHWPSQSNPSAARVAAAKVLKDNIRFNGKKAVPSLVMGDFNTVTRDYPHPFHSVLFQGENPLQDIYDIFMDDKTIDMGIKNSMPLGTYYYIPKMEWNRLDTFFANKELIAGRGLYVDHASYRILFDKKISRDFTYTSGQDSTKPHFGSKVTGIPWGYNHKTEDLSKLGFSDHFPVKVDLLW